MAFTVTATGGGVSFQRGVDLFVRVLTNATETGGAAAGGATAATAAASGSLTPNFSSSYVAFSISEDAVTTMAAAAASNTYDYSPAGHTDTWVYRAGHYSGTVTAGTPLTYGASSGAGDDHENHCAYEIPASGGTVTVDGSSPAGVFGDTSASSTTASFTPPVGSVLVAMVVTGGSGAGAGQSPSVSSTDGTGMAWTRRAISSTSDNFQVTSIFTATVLPATAPFTRSAVAETSRTWQRRWTRTVRPVIPPQVQQVTAHAGAAAVAASAAPPPGFNPFFTSTGGSGYNAWLQDQQGTPRLMLSEQAWALPWNAGRWNSGDWQSDFTAYFSNRAAQGYNAWYGVVWGNSHVDSAALSGGRSWDGVYPLNVNGTPGAIATGSETVTLNSSFWSRVDAFIATAMRYGVTVFMNLSMSYDVSDTGGIWQHATNTQGTAFGNALASRYPQANWPNLQWFFGDDDDGPNDSFYQAILTGIQNAGDTRALISIEQFTNTNSHVSFDTGSAFSGTFGAPNATYNWGYCYDAPYFGMERSYAEGGTFAHIVPVYGDGIYYGDTGSGTTADRCIRNFTWWALASGARGFTATSGPSDLGGGGLWTWQSGAVGRLTSDPNGAGTWTTVTAGAIRSFVSGLADWHKLIPDTGNVFITAGRGTRGTCDVPGGAFNFRNTNNYVAGSITPAGTLAVIYCKAAMSITIDQSKLSAGYTATWVDPVTLATTSTATGSTYASAGLGNNSAGDPDWVLVLQGAPAVNATAGAAAVSAVANPPVPAVTATAGVAAVSVVGRPATAAEGAAAGAAAVSAAAPAPSAVVTATAGVAAVSAAAPAATGSGSSSGTANAGVAVISAVAPAPSPGGAASAGAAVASPAALAPQAAITVTAGVASVPAVARAAAAADTAAAAVAVVGAVAPGASVTTSSSGTANAAAATVSAAAPAATGATVSAAGTGAVQAAAKTAAASPSAPSAAPAPGLVVARAPVIAVFAQAQAATVLAVTLSAAGHPVAPFTVGTLTASDAPGGVLGTVTASGGSGGVLTASDTRTGGPGG